ncbi:beta galactosidase jelly roll domain-containing protein [Rhodocaloribacter litoris]|uniref:sialate O-acetylesterase n=1 Tax=Rhodocaloribacter litoris TaxID=2558931 RepID=UPI001420B333|nr:sialate O-acetylesterase [Rhodocaloribacter litoris]QXD15447.1 beta galactosidase jelly roll domain-containing protein [Rhodocaloribacter litoris]
MERLSVLPTCLPGLLILCLLAGCGGAERSPAFRLSRLFEDGMVLQRGAPVPVWGWAAPGTRVIVTFDGQAYETTAGGDGRWRVALPALEAGGPHEMTVAAGGEPPRRIRDILVGDVWVASGQSNMEWVVADAMNAEAEIVAADDPQIRHFKVPRSWSYRPEDSLAGGTWEVADPEHVGDFSAVGYFFARELRRHVGVPVGIINTTWGGSRIEPWMRAEALGMDTAAVEALRAEEAAREQAILDRVRARLGTLPDRDPGLVDGEARWAAPDLDDSAWFTIPVPGLWEAAGFEGVDGVAWYRTTFTLTAEEARQGITLGLGMIDDSDITWVGGVEVGRTDNAWNLARVYTVPPAALREGENLLAVRVEDYQGGGGIHGSPEAVYVEVNGVRRPLPGPWRFMVGQVTIGTSGNKNQVPTVLWNKMVHPLLPYPIRGVIWYQGESNANTLEEAYAYRELFPTMIRSWREAWGLGDFPFLWVQLANFMAEDETPPSQSAWALLRESQHAALALPNTAQAVIIDLGEADDIHPRNKQDVGRRLALAARRVAYGEDVVASGPVYRSHSVEGRRVFVSFDHAGGGLVTREGGRVVRGFAVAGADRRFVWAEARIEGDRVVVWSDRVPAPVAVRYAWANNPARANLYNREGLPAAPFRTDTW